jgi:hypothetical protein
MNIVKETPLLFKAEMVQALLAGKKTQTRRIVKKYQEAKGWQKDVIGTRPNALWWAIVDRRDNMSYREVFMEGPFGHDVPCDPDDFGRCYRLLRLFPTWRARLGEVSAKYPRWKPMVDAWDELTALYEEEIPKHYGPAHKLYARMLQLRGIKVKT